MAIKSSKKSRFIALDIAKEKGENTPLPCVVIWLTSSILYPQYSVMSDLPLYMRHSIWRQLYESATKDFPNHKINAYFNKEGKFTIDVVNPDTGIALVSYVYHEILDWDLTKEN